MPRYGRTSEGWNCYHSGGDEGRVFHTPTNEEIQNTNVRKILVFGIEHLKFIEHRGEYELTEDQEKIWRNGDTGSEYGFIFHTLQFKHNGETWLINHSFELLRASNEKIRLTDLFTDKKEADLMKIRYLDGYSETYIKRKWNDGNEFRNYCREQALHHWVNYLGIPQK